MSIVKCHHCGDEADTDWEETWCPDIEGGVYVHGDCLVPALIAEIARVGTAEHKRGLAEGYLTGMAAGIEAGAANVVRTVSAFTDMFKK